MSEHYFTQKPQSKNKPQTWNSQIKEKLYTFTTDEGVFSKNAIDFGTRLLIEQFRQPDIKGDFLDLGCGYGPIGIALASEWEDRHIVMVDINERALSLAKRNAAQNNVSNVEFVLSDRLEQLEERTFASIITNPPIRAGKEIVHTMFEESERALKDKGELWIVIQRKQGAPSAKKKLATLFEYVEMVARKKGYFIYRAIKVDEE